MSLLLYHKASVSSIVVSGDDSSDEELENTFLIHSLLDPPKGRLGLESFAISLPLGVAALDEWQMEELAFIGFYEVNWGGSTG